MIHSTLKTNLRKCLTIQTIAIPTLTRFACTVVFKASFIYSVSIERISNEIRMKYFLAKIRSLKIVEMTLMVLNNKLLLKWLLYCSSLERYYFIDIKNIVYLNRVIFIIVVVILQFCKFEFHPILMML